MPKTQAQDTPKALAVLSEGMDYFMFFVRYTGVLLERRSLKKGLSEFVLVFEDNSLLIPVTVTRCLHRGFMGAV